MDKQDWIRKLTSRKFYLALATMITGIVSFLKNPTTDAQTITSLILALGSVLAYCISEGLVDAASAHGDTYIIDGGEGDEPETHPPEEE